MFTALEVSRPEYLAEGSLRESLSRGEVPGVGLEGCTPGGSEIRELGTDPRGLAARLADLVAGWQRAHLVGPGFGSEEFLGLLLAPRGVNQQAQRQGIELFLRSLRGQGLTPDVQVRLEGRRLAIPPEGGGYDHVDVLTSLHYDVHVARGAGHHVRRARRPRPTGDYVLFLSAGIALLVVLLAWAAARALRPSYWLTDPWLGQVIAATPWRGPPPWHWPRVSLCVIRV